MCWHINCWVAYLVLTDEGTAARFAADAKIDELTWDLTLFSDCVLGSLAESYYFYFCVRAGHFVFAVTHSPIFPY